MEEGEKPVVRFTIFEDSVASLWATVPQFGIDGWAWCVGGTLAENAHEKAVEKLRQEVREHCERLTRPIRVPGTTLEQRELAQQIMDRGFDLVEDQSIVPYMHSRRSGQ